MEDPAPHLPPETPPFIEKAALIVLAVFVLGTAWGPPWLVFGVGLCGAIATSTLSRATDRAPLRRPDNLTDEEEARARSGAASRLACRDRRALAHGVLVHGLVSRPARQPPPLACCGVLHSIRNHDDHYPSPPRPLARGDRGGLAASAVRPTSPLTEHPRRSRRRPARLALPSLRHPRAQRSAAQWRPEDPASAAGTAAPAAHIA